MFTCRLANAYQHNKRAESKLWSVIKEIKLESSIKKYSCRNDGWYDATISTSQLETFEQKLKIKPSVQRYENMSVADLKIAGKMFVYLNICPPSDDLQNWVKTWADFYYNLFNTQPIDKIILALNRMNKILLTTEENMQVIEDQTFLEKVFNKTASVLSLKYKEIRRLIPEQSSNNSMDGNYPPTNFKNEGINININKM